MGMESGQMKIGIIGAGKLGTAKAGRLIKMGHPVMLSFSRDLERRWRLLWSHTRRSRGVHSADRNGRNQLPRLLHFAATRGAGLAKCAVEKLATRTARQNFRAPGFS